MGTAKNAIKAMKARRKDATKTPGAFWNTRRVARKGEYQDDTSRKRSVHVVHEHFERLCNAASAPSVNF